METKLMEYMISIAEHKSISRAADELYLTQSALNQQLLKLEKELGAPLFIRIRNRWELTDIGELYVENAKEMLQIKRQTYKQIEDMARRWNGTITIGLMPERGIQMFTAIFPQIHAMYPDTRFQPQEETVEAQVALLDTHQLDFSFQTIYERKYKHLIYDTILYEPFYLCVPKSHRLAYRERLEPEQYPQISLREFKDDLFTLVRKSSTMRVVLDRLFEHAGFKPKLLFESTSMRTMLQLAKSGECCTIIPRFYAPKTDDVSYFILGDEASWELTAVHAQNHYMNNAAKDFIRMASHYWKTHLYIE